MGILDNALRPHLEEFTKFYKADKLMWMSMYKRMKMEEISHGQNAKLKRQKLEYESEKFRQEGNTVFKARDFDQALLMYTKSIAAAREGPLASLAYFNRFLIQLLI
jgi:hypothetical protein